MTSKILDCKALSCPMPIVQMPLAMRVGGLTAFLEGVLAGVPTLTL
ncbi:MAG: hypothetical protein R3F29_11340 [Planctomycetota bacterium]